MSVFARSGALKFAPQALAMATIVLASNILVQYPFEHFGLQDLITWGSFTYPFAFCVSDLTNRWYGPAVTRRVILVGFVLGLVMSALAGDVRIAIASGTAFLVGQLLDVTVFNRLRRMDWWQAPLASSTITSAPRKDSWVPADRDDAKNRTSSNFLSSDG